MTRAAPRSHAPAQPAVGRAARWRRVAAAGALLAAANAVLAPASPVSAATTALDDRSRWATPRVATLADLSIDALRARPYGSRLRLVAQLGSAAGDSEYSRHYVARGGRAYATYLAEYGSDGNRVYTRIDLPPTAMPAAGHPVVIFLHGWYSNVDAPAFDFSYRAGTQYADVIDAYVQAGFVVLYPGWRGYGTVHGRPADGIGFSETWNNASYVGPTYFAIDVLNLLDSLQTLSDIDWARWPDAPGRTMRIDLSRVYLAGHSQGGDVALQVLAVAGEGSRVRNPIAAGSIWAGCFPSRFQQLETYGPMDQTLQAFMSGDGTWTGTASGTNGAVNVNFVFGWPPDWIETADPRSPVWTWQAKHWALPSVADSLAQKYAEMYDTLNRHVANLGDAKFAIRVDAGGRAQVIHDPRVAAAMARIGGFGYPEYLREPLNLHYSDQDYYSLPAWNEDLSARINAAGGRALPFVYPGNTHSLEKSEHAWFSAPGVVPGFRLMLARDLALFGARGPEVAE